MTPRSETLLHMLLLLMLGGILYFPYLNATPFFDKGEPREALAVQDIVQRGEWLVPLKRATDVPSKPPLFHWSAALVTQFTGLLNEATVRFPSALYAILGVLLVYWLGCKVYDAKTALLGAAILATMIVYQDQAVSARVDMTMSFVVILTLVLFYALYRGYLTNPVWFYVFFAVAGIGTLAKGPLSVLLLSLVAGSFAIMERRWDRIKKFALHPGIILFLLLASGWYVVAVNRGGDGFFDRQIMEENLSRFAGGSGHSHPFYYYVPYLFSQTLPWGIFLPLVLWDVFKKGFHIGDDRLFLQLWFVVMLVFFSVAAGKRAVYLLPLCPALALLSANWFRKAKAEGRLRNVIFRSVAVFAAVTGGLLLIITVGAIWSHDQGWFFGPIEGLLKPKDRANVIAVRTQLDDFGWSFTLASTASAFLWISLARSLWSGRMLPVAYQLVAVGVLNGMISGSIFMPAIAQAKSYREFMVGVNRQVDPGDKMFLYGDFNSDQVIFYAGRVIDKFEVSVQALTDKVGAGNGYLIMTAQSVKQIENASEKILTPVLESKGKGPEGDARLMLVRAELSAIDDLKDSSLSMAASAGKSVESQNRPRGPR